MTRMSTSWPAVPYERWRKTCDTLHAHTQVLGKLAARLAPAEPELQHAALRLTVRGWETALLPAPDRSGAFVVALDLRSHHAVVEHTSGRVERIPLTPDRAVGDVTRDVLASVGRLAGSVEIDPRPQEVPWHVPLDEDREHASYDPAAVGDYFAAATRVAHVLACFRAPFRGRSTPVACWWGAFDLAVNVFSGVPVDPPSDDFISRNSADAETVAVGWWPGDERHPRAAFYGYAFPAVEGLSAARISPAAARWDDDLAEFILAWDDVRGAADPHDQALDFARSVFRAASALAGWADHVAGSLTGGTPPLRPRRPVPPERTPARGLTS